jgi:hypothetical protein
MSASETRFDDGQPKTYADLAKAIKDMSPRDVSPSAYEDVVLMMECMQGFLTGEWERLTQLGKALEAKEIALKETERRLGLEKRVLLGILPRSGDDGRKPVGNAEERKMGSGEKGSISIRPGVFHNSNHECVKTSYIYWWQEAKVGGIKVGHGEDPQARMCDYARDHGFSPKIDSLRKISVIKPLAYMIEQIVHSKLASGDHGFARFGKYELFMFPQEKSYDDIFQMLSLIIDGAVQDIFSAQAASITYADLARQLDAELREQEKRERTAAIEKKQRDAEALANKEAWEKTGFHKWNETRNKLLSRFGIYCLNVDSLNLCDDYGVSRVDSERPFAVCAARIERAITAHDDSFWGKKSHVANETRLAEEERVRRLDALIAPIRRARELAELEAAGKLQEVARQRAMDEYRKKNGHEPGLIAKLFI